MPVLLLSCAQQAGRTQSSLTTVGMRGRETNAPQAPTSQVLPGSVWSWCCKKTHLNRHSYTNSQRILRPFAHWKLQTYTMWFFATIQSFSPCAISLLWSAEGALHPASPIQKVYMYKWKEELVARTTSKSKLICTYQRMCSTAAGAPCSYFVCIKKEPSSFFFSNNMLFNNFR